MNIRAFVIVASVVALSACGLTMDPRATSHTSLVLDPVGDAFGSTTTTRWDATRLSITQDPEGITVLLEFTADVVSPTTGSPNAMIAFVDLDTDQSTGSGGTPAADEFRQGPGSAGIGSDYQVDMSVYDLAGTVAVVDAGGAIMGRVKPEFSGKQVTVRITRALIGNDDGFLNAVALVGAGNSASDLVPDNGHLSLDSPISLTGGGGVGSRELRFASGRYALASKRQWGLVG